MFTRARWFLIGSLTTLGATAYVATKVRSMRERVTPKSVAKATALTAADAIAFTGRRIRPAAKHRNRALSRG